MLNCITATVFSRPEKNSKTVDSVPLGRTCIAKTLRVKLLSQGALFRVFGTLEKVLGKTAKVLNG